MLERLPGELLPRVFDALDCLASRASACCVCRQWSNEVAVGWQSCEAEARACAQQLPGFSQAPQAFVEAGTLDELQWASAPGVLRYEPNAPASTAGWRGLCRARCAASSLLTISNTLAVGMQLPFFCQDECVVNSCVRFFGPGRLGCGFSADVYMTLKAVAPAATLSPGAQATLDELLARLVAKLRAALPQLEERSPTLDELFEAIEAVHPPALASAAVQELESATPHLGHTPQARTNRPCLFNTAASAAAFAGLGAVLPECMRLMEFLCVDLLGLADTARERRTEHPAGIIERTDIIVAVRNDAAWGDLCSSLFGSAPSSPFLLYGSADAELAGAGVRDLEAWASAATKAAPLSCAGCEGAAFVPLSVGALEAVERATRAHTRYVSCAGSSSATAPPPQWKSTFELDNVTVPVALPVALDAVRKLEAWGASRIAFVRFSPDSDSNTCYPAFVVGELPDGMLAGLAVVQIVQD